MLKISVTNIFFFFLIKYIVFYLLLAFKNDNFYFFELTNIKYFMYWWLLLFIPVVCFFLFVLPLRSLILLKTWPAYILVLFVVFVAEYFLYTYLASQMDLNNGVYNGLLSILLFSILFYKNIGIGIKAKSI